MNKQWLPALALTLAGLSAVPAQAEDFYLTAGVGRVRASGMGDASVSLQLAAGVPVRRDLAVEMQHVTVQDVGSWFDDSDGAPRRVFSSHTGVAGVYHFNPNPSVRFSARMGLGTTVQDGSDASVSGRRIWELEPGVAVSGNLRRDLRVSLELNRFWRSEVNVLAISGSWLF